MIRLFLKFSIATILLGIFSRWLFFTYLESNVYTDRERVISGLTEVQLDGLRLLASELNSADEQTRQHRWEVVQKEFQSPIEIRPLAGEGVGGTSGRTSNYEATASLLSWRRFLRHCRKAVPPIRSAAIAPLAGSGTAPPPPPGVNIAALAWSL